MIFSQSTHVVSGLSSSKMLAFSMLIKEFCGGQAWWNDRAIFIETDLKPASEQSVAACQVFSNIWQSNAKFALCPIRNPIEPSILGNLPIATHLSLVWGPFRDCFSYPPTSPNWLL